MHSGFSNNGSTASRVEILVVRPHPDDESSLTGGLLAYYGARGVRTGVVTCTGGEEGEIHDPDLDPVADFPRLREIRERELRNACEILNVAEVRLLGYRDSGMKGTPANQHPDAFTNADLTEAAGRLVRIIRELRPLVMVVEPPGGVYEHPDHVRAHSVGVQAYHAAGHVRAYPEAGPRWEVPRLYAAGNIDDGRWIALLPEFRAAGLNISWLEERQEQIERGEYVEHRPGPEAATVVLDVGPYTEVQRRALLAHRTQMPPDSFFVKIPPDLRRKAFATAYLTRMEPPAPPGHREPDLLHGLEHRRLAHR